MEKNKLIIAAVVVVVLVGGFLAIRQSKGKQATAEHDRKILAVVLKNAKTNDRAGLRDMARAIVAFHKAKKTYPPTLQALYPEFIALKGFIDELNWDYQVRGDGFLLAKRVTDRGRTMVASIDQSMQIGGSTATVAARVRQPPAKGLAAAGPAAAPATFSLAQVLEPLAVNLPGRPEQEVKPTAPAVLRNAPRTIEEDAAIDPTDIAGRSSDSFLVWRRADGSLGFGNVQYPGADRLYIASSERWYHVHQSPAAPLPAGVARGNGPPADSSAGAPLLRSAEGFLAWKDESGAIGFGNVQYPTQTPSQILAAGGWQPLEQDLPPPARPKVVEPGGQTGPADDAVTAVTSDTQYLTWQDKNSVIGFGNVQYPETGALAFIHVNGRWEKRAN